MTDAANSNAPRRSRSWGRRLTWIAASLVALLVVFYFVATSSAFLKAVVLPRVGQAIQAEVNADSISLSPFSHVTLRKLRFQTKGAEPLVAADEARVRYSLSAILAGNINVAEISLSSPIVQIVQEADGTSNLDPLLKTAGKPAAPAAPGKPLQLDIRNVALKNGLVRLTQKKKDGSVQNVELANLEVALDKFQNGQAGKINLSADLKLETKYPASTAATNDLLQSKFTGAFDLGVDAQLKPQTVKGNARVDLSKGEGAFQELAGLGATLQADLTPTDVRQLALRFERRGQGLGQIAASGPFDLAKTEGRLNLAIQSIDRQVLNLIGAKQGWDFGGSTLNATNVINLGQSGALLGATGRITGRQISLRQNNQTTPILDVDLDYQVSVDLQKKTAVVQTLSLSGRQEQQNLLTASLDRPMNLAWGDAAGALPDSTFQLALQQLNLKSWQPLLGTNLPTGQVDLQLGVQALRSGKQLAAKLAVRVQDLAARLGTNAVEQAEFKGELEGEFMDFNVANVKQFQFELRQKNSSVAKGSGAGRYDRSKNEAAAQIDTDASLSALIQQFPMPSVNASNGALKVHATFAQKDGRQTANGSLTLTDFAGGYAEYRFQNLQAAVECNLDVAQGQVQIQRATATLRQANEPPSRIELSGRYHLTNQTAQITFQVADLNQGVLRPALAPSLGEMKLLSASLNATGTASYDPKGDSAVQGEFVLSNAAVDDPQKRIPNAPLGVRLQIDAALRQQMATLKKCVASFSQGNQPAGQLDVSGRFNLTNHAAELAFKIADLNQTALGLGLAGALGDTKLVSIAVNGAGSAKYDPKGDSILKADVNVSNWVMRDPKQQFPAGPVSVELKADGSLRQQIAEVRQFAMALKQGTNSLGRVDLSGRCNLTNYASQATFKIADLNEFALRPALASALSPNKLVSVSLNGSGSASYDPNADSAVKAELKVSNLVAEDPQKTLPRSPLSAEFQVDGSIRQQVLDLKQLAVALSPTQRAQNQIQLQGRVDLKKTNASPSQLNLKAASLDLTPYYDLFAAEGQSNAPASSAKPVPVSPPGEPTPVELPLEQLTADVKVDRFYLREIAVTNLQATAKINRGEVTLKRFQLSLNGAPVSASGVVNLAVPGFTYDLTFQADRIPLEPIANSFAQGTPGQYKGDLIAQAQIKGAGTTGAGLQKNLSGQLALSLTNLNLEVVGPKTKRLLEPIALVLRVPELTATPLNWVNAKADIGRGQINLNQFGVMSQAFEANGQGTVKISEVLTNSPLDIPISISLRRSLAEKANLVTADTPANAAYVPLPTFAKLQGTLGDPKTEVNKLVISGLLLRSAGGIPQVGGKAGGILQGIGGVLTGERPAAGGTNSLFRTNAPAGAQTNKPPKLNPLDLLRLLPQKK